MAIAWWTSASAQQQPEEKAPKPTPSPTQQKLGTELDGPVIVNTDLITLTITVTDTYGRYVSGLSKNAFTVLEEKQPQVCSTATRRRYPRRQPFLPVLIRHLPDCPVHLHRELSLSPSRPQHLQWRCG